MARAFSVQVKEVFDILLNNPVLEKNKPVTPSFTITFTKYPYQHRALYKRKYEYTARNGFDLIKQRPWQIDLMGNYLTSDGITDVLKEIGAAPDYDTINQYKQVVVHHRTYTGVFNIEEGKEEKVMEIELK